MAVLDGRALTLGRLADVAARLDTLSDAVRLANCQYSPVLAMSERRTPIAPDLQVNRYSQAVPRPRKVCMLCELSASYGQ